ncbi:MAG: biotin/lipoate--protein ligase family protein [Alphaproteobacteria bacterium]|nr:biotin/lipoate--protein ligase family protein [Alphaproteobacteria bacterium]
MSPEPKLPPLYRLIEIADEEDARRAACRAAAEGADPATLVWSRRRDRLTCAVVLAPDRSYQEARQVVFVAVVAVGDALGAVVPAGVDVTFEWPARVLANQGLVAEVALDVPAGTGAGDVPPWLVVSVDLAVKPGQSGDYDESDLSVTTLYEEGCIDLTPGTVLEHFARYFLSWINRWQDDGFDPVRGSWTNRLPERGAKMGVELAGDWLAGRLVALQEDGALVIDIDGESRQITLDEVRR